MSENPAEIDLDALAEWTARENAKAVEKDEHTAFAERAFREHPGLKLETVGGTKIDPFDLRAGDVDVADVAFSLSNICRWHGHVERSVLEHSLDVMEFVRAEGEPVATQFTTLTHDAQEYILNDLARGVKQKPSMSSYREAEARAVEELRQLWRFDARKGCVETVKRADNLLLFLEADRWLPSRGRHFSGRTLEMEADVERLRGTFPPIRVAGKRELRRMFLNAFANLRRGRAGGGIIVGVTGYKRSGKNTFARVLCREGGFAEAAFADPLKQECAEFVGIGREEMNENKEAWRPLWQGRGAFARRMNALYWISKMRERFDERLWGDITDTTADPDDVYAPSFVISDMRYPNEAEFVREYAAEHGMESVIVRLRRADQPAVTEDPHESERGVDDVRSDREVECDRAEEVEREARDFLNGEWDGREK